VSKGAPLLLRPHGRARCVDMEGNLGDILRSSGDPCHQALTLLLNEEGHSRPLNSALGNPVAKFSPHTVQSLDTECCMGATVSSTHLVVEGEQDIPSPLDGIPRACRTSAGSQPACDLQKKFSVAKMLYTTKKEGRAYREPAERTHNEKPACGAEQGARGPEQGGEGAEQGDEGARRQGGEGARTGGEGEQNRGMRGATQEDAQGTEEVQDRETGRAGQCRPMRRCVRASRECPTPKTGRSRICAASSVSADVSTRRHLSIRNWASSAMRKWSNPHAYGVAITRTPLAKNKEEEEGHERHL